MWDHAPIRVHPCNPWIVFAGRCCPASGQALSAGRRIAFVGWGRGSPSWRASSVYRGGQARAEKLVHEAARRMGANLGTLVDEIDSVLTHISPKFRVMAGTRRRVIILNRAAVYGKGASLKLLKAAHEVGHAQVCQWGLRLKYAVEEALVEGMARKALRGALSPFAQRATKANQESWLRQARLSPQLRCAHACVSTGIADSPTCGCASAWREVRLALGHDRVSVLG